MDDQYSLIGEVKNRLSPFSVSEAHEFVEKANQLIQLENVKKHVLFVYSDQEKRYVIGGSCFNIKERALILENFTKKQVSDLFHQHTRATGQQFDKKALDYIYELTQGQPWLVNAFG
jgi:hypothetical protein